MKTETNITPKQQGKKAAKLESLSTALRKNLQRRKKKTAAGSMANMQNK